MKINVRELMAALERDGEKAYDKLSELRKCIKQIQEDWVDKNYVEVRIVNQDGNVVKKLKDAFPELDNIWWEGEPNCCGKNVVLVPGPMWNDILKEELSEFDSYVGHHQETRRDWKLRDDVELPYDLKSDIENLKKELEKNGKSTDEIVLPGYLTHSWPWSRYAGTNWSRYFVEVQTVIREWDEELNVIDRRKWSKDDEAMKSKTIEI